jgi:RNA polymerase sigma-70 factor (ECF subfamily)
MNPAESKIDHLIQSSNFFNKKSFEQRIIAALPQLLDFTKNCIRKINMGQINIAEDILQTALTKAVRAELNFRGTTDAEFFKWLHVIIQNEVRLEARSKANKIIDPKVDLYFHPDENRNGEERFTSHSESPDTAAINSEQLEIVKSILTEKEFNILTMLYVEGLTYEEISEQLNVPAGTLKVQVKRAREKITGPIV